MTGEATFHCVTPANIDSTVADVRNCLNQMPYLDATGAQIQYEVEVRPRIKEYGKRSGRQNNAMWKLFRIAAMKLKEAGIDARKFFKPEVEIPVTPEMLHEQAFNTIALAMYGRTSSDLTKVEISEVGEVFVRHVAQSHGIALEWPHD